MITTRAEESVVHYVRWAEASPGLVGAPLDQAGGDGAVPARTAFPERDLIPCLWRRAPQGAVLERERESRATPRLLVFRAAMTSLRAGAGPGKRILLCLKGAAVRSSAPRLRTAARASGGREGPLIYALSERGGTARRRP